MPGGRRHRSTKLPKCSRGGAPSHCRIGAVSRRGVGRHRFGATTSRDGRSGAHRLWRGRARGRIAVKGWKGSRWSSQPESDGADWSRTAPHSSTRTSIAKAPCRASLRIARAVEELTQRQLIVAGGIREKDEIDVLARSQWTQSRAWLFTQEFSRREGLMRNGFGEASQPTQAKVRLEWGTQSFCCRSNDKSRRALRR